jgi:hypothetical protein
MQLHCYEDGYVVGADLWLRQSWVTGPRWLWAKDLAKSWLTALAPHADQQYLATLAEELDSLRLDEEFKTNVSDPTWSQSRKGRLVLAYLGLIEEAFIAICTMTSVTIQTSHELDSDAWTRITIMFP